MDSHVYEAIQQAVAAGIGRHNLALSIFTLVILAAISVVAILVKAYVNKKAENLATKSDFAALQEQLAENTRLTEGIKQEFSKESTLWQCKLEFKRRQIAEFYGPLLVLAQRTNWIQKQRIARMEKSLEEHGGAQNDEWARILRAFYDDHILPLRHEMVECFKTKSFLMEQEHDSFRQFLQHDAEDKPLYTLWRDHQTDGRIPAVGWPQSLEDDIRRDKERLEIELRDLMAVPPIKRTVAQGTKLLA